MASYSRAMPFFQARIFLYAFAPISLDVYFVSHISFDVKKTFCIAPKDTNVFGIVIYKVPRHGFLLLYRFLYDLIHTLRSAVVCDNRQVIRKSILGRLRRTRKRHS